jgi:hypothetical protein
MLTEDEKDLLKKFSCELTNPKLNDFLTLIRHSTNCYNSCYENWEFVIHFKIKDNDKIDGIINYITKHYKKIIKNIIVYTDEDKITTLRIFLIKV